MGERAKVDSIEALKSLRRTLVKFAEAANAALGDAESDVTRMLTWLETEQLTRWQTQVRLRTDLVTKAKDALREKQLYKSPTGGRQSTVDEEKALKIAVRRLEEAEQKLANVKKYTHRIGREQHLFRGSVQRFATCVQVEIPNARAKLDNMIDKLEQYASTAPPSEATSQAASGASMGRGSSDAARADLIDTLRERTVVARRDIPSAVPLELPPQWGVAELAETDIAALRRTPLKESPDVGAKILIDAAVANVPRVYLERSVPATDRETDSGWLLAPVETDVTTLHAMPISMLLEVRPDLRDILRLPTWSLVVLERDGRMSIAVDEDDRDIRASENVAAAE
jgi:hypothetical protein